MTTRALTIVAFAVAYLCAAVPSSAEPKFLSKRSRTAARHATTPNPAADC